MKKILEKLRSYPAFKKYELFIPPVLAGLLIIILSVAVIGPNVFQYFEIQGQITQTESQITFFEKKAATLQGINKEEYTGYVNSSLDILPNDTEAPAAIAQLYYVLGVSGMSIENISFSNVGSSEAKSFKISLELKGSAANLTNFILQLKEAPRIMRINTLEINSNTNSAEILASVTIDAFYEPLPAAISKVDQKVEKISDKSLEVLSKLKTTSFPTTSAEEDFTGPKGKPNPFE